MDSLPDDQHCLARQLLREPLAQRGIRPRIKRRERIIKDIHLRLRRQRPGDREALTLPTRDIAATLRDRAFHTIIKLSNKVTRLSHLCRMSNRRLICFRRTIGNITGNTAPKQHTLLRNIANLAS